MREFHDFDIYVVAGIRRAVMERVQLVDAFHPSQQFEEFRLTQIRTSRAMARRGLANRTNWIVSPRP